MWSLERLVNHWRWVAAEPEHGSLRSTHSGDAAKHAAVGELARELAEIAGREANSLQELTELVSSLRERARVAQVQATKAAMHARESISGTTDEWLGRSAGFACCATDLERLINAGIE